MKILVRVVPNAKPEGVAPGEHEWVVRVAVSAREGRANARMIELLAEHLEVAKGQIDIARGASARRKLIYISP